MLLACKLIINIIGTCSTLETFIKLMDSLLWLELGGTTTNNLVDCEWFIAQILAARILKLSSLKVLFLNLNVVVHLLTVIFICWLSNGRVTVVVGFGLSCFISLRFFPTAYINRVEAGEVKPDTVSPVCTLYSSSLLHLYSFMVF